MTIDLVYLWVDGSDPAWVERRASYLNKIDQSDNESLCEGRIANSDELRYSLRSVEMYAPWINHIYVVTDRQCPEWLETNNPKITIVDHKDLLPKEFLPAFNSCAIELGIINIEGLSEHFLYANDDMMFGRALSPDLFFTKEGATKCYFKKSKSFLKPSAQNNTYNHTIKIANDAIARNFNLRCEEWVPRHQIDAYTKSSIKRCIERYKEWSDSTMANKFRTREDMQRHIFSLYAVAVGEGVAIIKKHPILLSIRVFIQRVFGIGANINSLYLAIHKSKTPKMLRNLKPQLLCVNDTQRTTADMRREIKKILSEIYPTKSQFEKDDLQNY